VLFRSVPKPSKQIEELQQAIGRMISPELGVEIDTLESGGKSIIRVQVPKGENPPYAIDEYKIYVRDDNETTLAVRDEIVSLVLRGGGSHAEAQQVGTPQSEPIEVAEPDSAQPTPPPPPPQKQVSRNRGRNNNQSQKPKPQRQQTPPPPPAVTQPDPVKVDPLLTEKHSLPPKPSVEITGGSVAATNDLNNIPRAGVEIIGTESRNGTTYHVMRDLRNGNIVHNVTRESARRLWHYAIKQREMNPVSADQVQWSDEGDIGLWRSYRRGNDVRYDLVQRNNEKLRVFYGVSEAGMDGHWQQFLEPDEN
jgi:hypothetical protein